eukprot:136668-Chlamydomonas_euryale.AAC.3
MNYGRGSVGAGERAQVRECKLTHGHMEEHWLRRWAFQKRAVSMYSLWVAGLMWEREDGEGANRRWH